MKIIITLVLAGLPALASAQTAGSTLELVQGISAAASADKSIAAARENAAKPFTAQAPQKGLYTPYSDYTPAPVAPTPAQPACVPPHSPGYPPYSDYVPAAPKPSATPVCEPTHSPMYPPYSNYGTSAPSHHAPSHHVHNNPPQHNYGPILPGYVNSAASMKVYVVLLILLIILL